MYRKALEIDEALGRKDGMAIKYVNLGNVFRARGELEKAEAMHRKALEIDEALGRKEGMATGYVNLGLVFEARGEPEKAEAMYRRGLALAEKVGAQPVIDEIKGFLADLDA
jgi:tetratricopeptide (TPR) repeat protein